MSQGATRLRWNAAIAIRWPLLFEPYDTGLEVSGVVNVAGCGIEGRVAGWPLRLGTGPWAAGRQDDGAIWLGEQVPADCPFRTA